MSDSDMIAHYRVKLGPVWLHAVGIGAEAVVRQRLGDGDPVWQRASVELLASRPLNDWMGPFPRATRLRMWLVEADD